MLGEVIKFLVANSTRCMQTVHESAKQIHEINDFFELDNRGQWDIALGEILRGSEIVQEGLAKLSEFLG